MIVKAALGQWLKFKIRMIVHHTSSSFLFSTVCLFFSSSETSPSTLLEGRVRRFWASAFCAAMFFLLSLGLCGKMQWLIVWKAGRQMAVWHAHALGSGLTWCWEVSGCLLWLQIWCHSPTSHQCQNWASDWSEMRIKVYAACCRMLLLLAACSLLCAISKSSPEVHNASKATALGIFRT